MVLGCTNKVLKTAMEKKLSMGKCFGQVWCIVLVSFVFCILLLRFDYSDLFGNRDKPLLLSNYKNPITASNPNFLQNQASFIPRPPFSATTQNESQNPQPGALVADKSVSVSEETGKGAVKKKPLLDFSGKPLFSAKTQDENSNPFAVSANKSVSGSEEADKEKPPLDFCLGKYIYMHDLPSRFNLDMLSNCQVLTRGTDTNMCHYLVNSGLGPLIDNSEKILMNKSWFSTNQFLLEVIFHNRMKHYNCLTNDSSLASAIYVPFYAGLDIGRFLWGFNISVRDSSGFDLVHWLEEKPEWARMWGRDHFMVVGRISWDFRRQTDDESDWGSKLMFLPQSQNMTMLSTESSVWRNDYAIPYPTYFHPSKDREIFRWQEKLRRKKRRYLFTFAGAPRPEMTYTLRNEIIDQCRHSKRKCRFLNCNSESKSCENPVKLMKVLQSSVFCLQPRGDSYTRRSIFDSILAGCIPVFFHPGTAYVQYIWHLPRNYTRYSVYIPVSEIVDKKGSIEQILLRYSKDEVLSMREEVIGMIPRIVYADPRTKLETLEDAFDIAVKGILRRIDKIRKVMNEGGDPSVGFAEQNSFMFEFPVKWENLE